jgi:ATP-dependent DNA helicase RecQ
LGRASLGTVRTMSSSPDIALAQDEVLTTASEVFGHAELRPGQQEAIEALLRGHDVLLVAPTGAGKSLTYQLPAVLVSGPTVVISPLLALQRDQIESLRSGGRDTRAARISSAETSKERKAVFAEAAAGSVEFLFLAPEQLANDAVLQSVAELRPSLVAVDEAHCVSAWGHDFRPDYLRLGEFITALGSPRVIALTATAAAPVQADIVERLGLRDVEVLVHGFARPNIDLSVVRCVGADESRRRLREAVLATAGPGIVYCATRRATQEVAAELSEAGLRTAAYHAGLGLSARESAHRQFLAGDLDVIVATSAFGMGIDKPDVRYVFHAQVPGSLDSYYQEIGRAGRDGDPAIAQLFYRPEDLALARFHATGVPDRADVDAVVAVTSAAPQRLDPEEIAALTGLSRRRAGRIRNLLDQVTVESDPAAIADAVLAQAEAHRLLERSRVDMMRGYAETGQCRRQFLLAYFGEELPDPCDACDVCRAGLPEPSSAAAGSAFPVQARVCHSSFGEGTVMALQEDKVTVLFESVGYRTLHAPTVEEQGLLQLA